MNTPIAVRRCHHLEDFQACVELQRRVWGEADLEVEPTTMFVVAAHSGGQVLGAFDGEKLIGYTLAVVGLCEDGVLFLHSHMTGVEDGYRDRGVGRMLKLFQREDALGRGIRLIRWTFDPLEMRNAHFNLNRLGAICRTYLPNLYGQTTSPLHRGMATDRLVAEWYLDSPRVIAAIEGLLQPPVVFSACIGLRADLEKLKATDSPEVAQVQARLRSEFSAAFCKGYAAVATRNSAQGAEYLLAPWSEF